MQVKEISWVDLPIFLLSKNVVSLSARASKLSRSMDSFKGH